MKEPVSKEYVDRNLRTFDELDFEAWNKQNWKRFAEIHSEDVIVEGFGPRTQGIAPHIEAAKKYLTSYPEALITAHPISFGSGDWTCTIGEFKGGKKMVTVAHWRGGRIAEEYLFMQ